MPNTKLIEKIIQYKKILSLTDEHIEKLQQDKNYVYEITRNIVRWSSVSAKRDLPEDFIHSFRQFLDWKNISAYQYLSQDFILKHMSFIDIELASYNTDLTEDFIREYQDKVNWIAISCFQKLSEEFIREFQDKVCWDYISANQRLSENFIREFKDKVCWDYISSEQDLSLDFVKDFKDKVNWLNIIRMQNFSLDFIIKEGFAYLTNDTISYYAKILLENHYSNNLWTKLKVKLTIDTWLYKSTFLKKLAVIRTRKYDCYRNYFIAYKAIGPNRNSIYNKFYKYEVGQTYESKCDCSSSENSYGLSAWTKEEAEEYGGLYSKIVKVKIYYKDVGRVVHKNNKIRCFKQTFLT